MKKYLLYLFTAITLLCACTFTVQAAAEDKTPAELPGLTYDHSMELSYAQEISVDYYNDGYTLITIVDEGQYLLVPEGKEAPEGLDKNITVLQQPLDNIYLVATSAMDLFRAIDGIDNIRLSGTKENGWYIQEAKDAMEAGHMIYAGKYNAPDYELILNKGCDLAIESTMIHHNPEVQEKLEQFGIPVMVERSSYEESPLGRVEWIKLYGLLTGTLEQAEAFFQESVQQVQSVQKETQQQNGQAPTVVFFYFTSSGYANVRTPHDYIAQMIRQAGGSYAFTDEELGDQGSRSTVNMDLEQFFAVAKEADFLIYNSTVEGELASLDALLEKSPLMKDCKAVQSGNVWCTGQNMFQQVSGTAEMISDLHAVFSGDTAAPLNYLYRLQ